MRFTIELALEKYSQLVELGRMNETSAITEIERAIDYWLEDDYKLKRN